MRGKSPDPDPRPRIVILAPNPLLARTRPAAFAALALSAVALALWVAVATPALAAWLQAVDDRWHDLMEALAWEPLLHLARALAVVGSAWVTIPFALVVAGWLWRRRAWTRLRVWAGAVIPAYAVTITGKTLYARPRPDDRLMDVPTASFPSGHATDAAVIALTLVLVFVAPAGRRRSWLLLATGYALVMAWSRTYLRVHWLSDVSAGMCWGGACALLSALLVGSRNEPRPAPPPAPDSIT